MRIIIKTTLFSALLNLVVIKMGSKKHTCKELEDNDERKLLFIKEIVNKQICQLEYAEKIKTEKWNVLFHTVNKLPLACKHIVEFMLGCYKKDENENFMFLLSFPEPLRARANSVLKENFTILHESRLFMLANKLKLEVPMPCMCLPENKKLQAVDLSLGSMNKEIAFKMFQVQHEIIELLVDEISPDLHAGLKEQISDYKKSHDDCNYM